MLLSTYLSNFKRKDNRKKRKEKKEKKEKKTKREKENNFFEKNSVKTKKIHRTNCHPKKKNAGRNYSAFFLQ